MTTDAFTRPLDPAGRVIHFSVGGRPMLFNGHSGRFYPSLPSWAEMELERAVAGGPVPRTSGRTADVGARGPPAAFRRELAAYRRGRHASLRPEARQPAFTNAGAPSIVTVFLAQACNLRCRYCINHYGTFGRRPEVMSPATARRVLAWIRRLAAARPGGNLFVNLFGGEPLLARAAVEVLVRGLQELNRDRAGAEVRFVLATNGTFYHEPAFRLIAEQPDFGTVVVSLDGMPAAHDRNRPFVDGQGTYAVVAANLRRLMAEGVPYSVTCVLTKPYDYIAAAQALHGLGVRRLELKEVIDRVFGGTAVPDDCTGDLAEWEAQYLAYTDHYLAHLHAPDPVLHVDRWSIVRDFGRVLNPSDATERKLGCGIADEMVSVSADGRIMPCEALVGTAEMTLGDVQEGVDPDRFARFATRLLAEGQLRLDHPRCESCFAKRLCGGGCYAQCLERGRTLAPADERTCAFVRAKLRIDLYFLARLQEEHPAVFARFGGILE